MPSTEDLSLDVADGIALITFNRPDAQNTLTGPMMTALGEAYQRCDADDAVKVVIVTGSGTSFCAGADLSAGGDTFGDAEADFSSCPLSFQAWDVRKPVIAACNGHAIGVGLSIAMQADLRVFAEEGKYGFLQNRRGVVADFAMESVLPRVVGFERAFELLVRAPRLTGAEAGDWGLASRVVAAEAVLPTALELAEEMAQQCAPLVMGLHKRLLWQGMHKDLNEMIDLETRALHHSMQQPDAVEGGAAWFEKRPPQWTGSVSRDWPDGWDD
ncbi:MAG: enoyl-CoA hydratase-related protein [Pseudomonadota bacterium]